jgi:hypothetical protein
MYLHIFEHLFFTVTDFLFSWILLLPLFFLLIFFITTTFFLYFSLRNIFKIFFLTETLLLIVVIFLTQLAILYPNTSGLNYFYCQLILAAAAAEGALFLGLFSYLYEQQFLN